MKKVNREGRMSSLNINKRGNNMKKTLIVLLTAVLAISMLFVSCSNEAKIDEKVNVSFGVSQGRSLSSSASFAEFSEFGWWYKATTSSTDFNYGQRTGWTKLENGLATNLELSQGIWNFELCAVESGTTKENVDAATKAYYGSRSSVLIEKSNNGSVVTIAISVTPGLTGKGIIFISKDIIVNKRNGETSTIVANNYDIKKKDSSTKFTGVINGSAVSQEVDAGSYTVTIYYKETYAGATEGYILRATEPIDVTVYDSSTITVEGSIDEATQAIIINPVNKYKVEVSTTVTKTGVEFQDVAVTAPLTPAMSSSASDNTVVTVPESVISANAGDADSIKLKLGVEVTPASEAAANDSFQISSANYTSVAALNISLSKVISANEETLISSFTEPVVVTTYIAKNLNDVHVKFDGDGAQPTDIVYEKATGKLSFKTIHFSTFIVESTSEALIGEVAYDTLNSAISNSTSNDVIVLLKDLDRYNGSGVYQINKSVNIDGNGKTITYTGDNYAAFYLANLGNCTDLNFNLKNLNILSNKGGIYEFGTNTTLNIENCNINCEEKWALYHNGSAGGFTCNAFNSAFISGNLCQGIYISGSTITSSAAGRNQQLNLTDCIVEGSTGIEGKYTDMNLINCSVSSLVDEPSFEQFNNGSTTGGFAVVSTDNSMSPESPRPTAEIIIDGGSYNGAIGLSALVDKEEYPNFKEATYIYKNNPIINGSFLVECEADSIGFSSVMAAEKYINATPENTLYVDKKLKLLTDSSISGTGVTCVTDPAWFGSIDLNNKTLTVSNFSTVISQNNTKVENGKIVANSINKTTGEITGQSNGSYGLVVMANNVTLEKLEIIGGISLGGAKDEPCTPNAKGAKDAIIENCNVSTTSTWYAVCVQSGSSGTLKISNSYFERTSNSNNPLFQVAGTAGDFGNQGDTNTIIFENVTCKSNPFPTNSVKVGNTDVFSITQSNDDSSIRNVTSCVGYATATDCYVKDNGDGTWTISGTMSYTIQ